MTQAKPFVKWAGGKGRTMKTLDRLLPEDFDSTVKTYVEPFVGGGAMLFHVLSSRPGLASAVASDLNPSLIRAFSKVRRDPDGLLEDLHSMAMEYASLDPLERDDYYCTVRNRFNLLKDSSDVSALFIFLNRTCYNGLYRENSKGEFNTPFGEYANPKIADDDTIRIDSLLLRKVSLSCSDFERVLDSVQDPSAFVYLDPPYRKRSSSSFTKYTGSDFTDDDHARLAGSLRALSSRGVRWMLTNAYTPDSFFDELYSGFSIRRLAEPSTIGSCPSSRRSFPTAVITNY